MLILTLSTNIKASEETSLKQDAQGKYCINTTDDYQYFAQNIDKYENSEVVLTKDIVISNDYETSNYSFMGTFNGQNHCITYISKDSSKENISSYLYPDDKSQRQQQNG